MEKVILQHLDFSKGSFGPVNASPTYLNSIPLLKYRLYCNIESVTIRINSPNQTIIKVKYLFLDRTVEEETIEVNKSIELPIKRGDLITIESTQPIEGLKGMVEANITKKRSIRLEHVVCTFRREEITLQKINLFQNANLENYHMTIIDNGSTIELAKNSMVTVISSPNMGGTSGFTRGIVSGLENGSTHILLNDDDAFIAPETVFRIIQFLSAVSSDNVDYSISGIFLDINNPNIVRETGGSFENGITQIYNKGIDLGTDNGLLSILSCKPIKYSAWTCCCIPSNVIQKIGLPLPLFVRCDDIEYGLRLNGKILTIPGISIWHPTFSTYPLRYCYYDIRNKLIIIASTNSLKRESIGNIIDMILSEIAAYRYDCVDEMLKGVSDFMKGPDYVFNSCKDGMHKVNNVYKEYSINLRKELKRNKNTNNYSKNLRRITLNGLFLPPLKDIELQRCETETKYYYRVGKVLYTSEDGMGVIRKRSLFLSIKLTIKTIIA